MKLSIVTTLYKSSPYLQTFYEKIRAEAQKLTDAFEIIFVNDGSPDNSLELAKSLQDKDPAIKIINLSRNFGHHRAIITGLSYAKGDLVFLIDCDLEEDPTVLTSFWHEIHSTPEFDVVYGVQAKRHGKFLKRVVDGYFYKFINLLSEVKITENLLVVRMMTKRFVKNLLAHKERELVFVGISALTGFQQRAIVINKSNKGTSTYNLSQKINLALNFITSLTSKPLVYIFYFGTVATLIAVFSSLLLIFRKVYMGINAPGWASVIVSIWMIGGMIIFCLGIIGIYVGKIFIEVKQRPYTIIKDIYLSKHIEENE